LYTLGSLYSDNQQYPEAIKLLEQATEIYPIDDAYDRLSVAYLNLQNIPKAAQAAQKAVELTPQWWPYRKQWALCLAQLQRTDEAIQQFELALKQSPNNALMHLSLGNLWKRQNQLAKAESEYKLALQSSNPNPYTYKMLGDLYLQQEKNLLAISAYETFLKVLPNDPNAVSLKETVKNLKYKVEQEPLKSQKKQ
jgi:tetratricopeptide (TPR) repeat protein